MAATAAPALKAGAKGAKGNILTRKIGPLPGWAWVGIAVGGYYLYKKHEASTAAAAATTATPAASTPTSDVTAPSGYGYQGGGGSSGGGPWWQSSGTSSTPNALNPLGVNPGGTLIPASTATNAPAPGTPASIAANTLPPPGNGVTVAQDASAASQVSGQSVSNETAVYNQAPSALTALGYSPAQQALYYDPNPADLQAYNNAQPGIPTAQPAITPGAVQ